MNTFTNMYVTPLKTPLERTQIPSPMETIRMIFQVTIELLIIAFFIPIIIHDLRELRAWARGEEGEEDHLSKTHLKTE